MTTSDPETIEVLLIEDNPGDIRLFEEALKVIQSNIHLTVMRDGEQAINFFNKEHPFEDTSSPDLILLDLNLPRKSGHEVLEFLKSDPQNRHIPIIVLTSSQAPDDIQEAYTNQANCYIVKPVQLNDFFHVVKTLEQFWFTQAQLPSRGHHEDPDED